MERMKEFILSPEEIYYIGKVSGGKYLDYDYIAAMKDIGKRGKIKQQEILDSLERKGYAQEDFLGNLEVEPACIEILQPLYQGMYESELILREEAGESVHYKFHHMENRITSVECRSQEYRIRVQDKEGIERMLSPLLENNVQTEKKEAYIATDQAERSIILKGTHIGKDTCLYFYAEKGGYFYEMDPKQAEEKILRLVEKNVVCEQVKKILTGKITIDDVAAGEDIKKIERAQAILQNALQSLRAAQTEGANSKGQTAQAIYDKSQELINQIQRLDNNLEETTNYIRHVLAVYKAKDEMLKAIMASQNMF